MAKLRLPEILKVKEKWNASRKKSRPSPSLGHLHHDIWCLVLEELCEESPETVRSLRLVNRSFNDIAMPFVFRRLVITTGAGYAKVTTECLVHLLSDEGEHHRNHIRALTIAESYHTRGEYHDHLIERLIIEIPRLQEFSWTMSILIPLSTVDVLNTCHPQARIHLEHERLEMDYIRPPPPGSVFAPGSLHSLKLSVGGMRYADLGATSRILTLLLAFPTLRVLGLTEVEQLHGFSLWWDMMPHLGAATPPIGQLEELSVDGVWFGGMEMDPEVAPFASTINWHHVRRLELSYPPPELLSRLAPKLQSLKSFRAGPLMGQSLPEREIGLAWSESIGNFIKQVPGLEEIGLIAAHRTLPQVLVPQGRSLRRLCLHVGSDCHEGCQLPCQLSHQALATIRENCPHLEGLSVDFTTKADMGRDFLSDLAMFRELRHVVLVLKSCFGDGLVWLKKYSQLASLAKTLFKFLRIYKHGVPLERMDLECGIWLVVAGSPQAEIAKKMEFCFKVMVNERGKVVVWEENQRRRDEADEELALIKRNEKMAMREANRVDRRMKKEDRQAKKEAKAAEASATAKRLAWKDGDIPGHGFSLG